MTQARRIVEDLHTALQDPAGTRWPASELVRYLNDGQREIAVYRPDATATAMVFTLSAGVRQTLPAVVAALIEVVRNAAGTRSAITQVERPLLDAVEPDWASAQPDTTIHFMTDVRDPRAFDVYPPAVAGRAVETVVSTYPEPIADPASPGRQASTVTGDTSIAEKYTGALFDYALYRAWGKDAEFGGNSALSQERYASFAQAVGIEGQARVAVAPTVQD